MIQTPFNPFARSKLKFEEPIRLVEKKYVGWSDQWELTYVSSRGALSYGLLQKNFAVGALLTVDGTPMIVECASVSQDVGDTSVTVQVTAVTVASALSGNRSPASGTNTMPAADSPLAASKEPATPRFGTSTRRIIV